MFTTPSKFNKFLKEQHFINDIYEAMESDDYSDIVMAAMSSLKKGEISLQSGHETKCPKRSDKFRNQGNIAFNGKNAVMAIICYNNALRYAPNNSRALVLAFSNRSAVLFTIGYYVECLSDIEICFRLGCPADIVDKLNKRKEAATAKILHTDKAEILSFYEKIYHIENRNAEVPCASKDVDITVKDGEAKITATKDLKVGTVLAAESCFVGNNNYKLSNMATICRNCFSKAVNVIPCNGCCYVMFCGEKCKRICLQEYHKTECQIMDVIQATEFNPRIMLMVAGSLKFVHMCGSWKEAIVESHCTGSKRRRVSNASQMFDVRNKLSILNFDDENIFVHGNMYETSFICAKIIDCLDRIPSYFPQSPSEKALAQRALARIMMYLALFAKPTQAVLMEPPHNVSTNRTIPRLMFYGMYPFIGKLKNSCTPNTIIACADNKYVLVALQPITNGSELTLSHMGHYLDSRLSGHEKNLESLIMFGTVCKCFVCMDEWKTRGDVLTTTQKAAYAKYKSQIDYVSNASPFESFALICNTLTCLSSVSFSEEYADVYRAFRDRIVFGTFNGAWDVVN